jgi:hypothetical protein
MRRRPAATDRARLLEIPGRGILALKAERTQAFFINFLRGPASRCFRGDFRVHSGQPAASLTETNVRSSTKRRLAAATAWRLAVVTARRCPRSTARAGRR